MTTRTKPAQGAAKTRAKTQKTRTNPADVKRSAKKNIRSKDADTGLTAQMEAFAAALAAGLNNSDAYREAYPVALRWRPGSVHSKAAALARDVRVANRVQALLKNAAAQNEADVSLVLRQYLTRLRADPRAITEVRVGPCRHCWGEGHRYQFTDGELEDARAKHELKREELLAGDRGRDIGEFDERGGGGYAFGKAPNQDCPTCAGIGQARAVLKDSRNYDEAALSLYEGVKETKDGIEVKVASRDKALEQVARHVGFFEKDKEKAGGVFDPEALGALFGASMQKSLDRQAQVLAEREELKKG